MAQIRQHAPTDPDDARPVLSLMIRPWTTAARNEAVRLVLGNTECAARAAVWVEISYGLEDAPLNYLRYILQVDDWRCTERIEQLLKGETPYATWRSGCPPALLMARPGSVDAQGDPAFHITLQLDLGGLTDSSRTDGAGITFSLDQVSGDELLRFGEAFDRELRQALEHRPAHTATAPGLEVNAFSSRVNSAAYDALGTDYTHDYLSEPFFRDAFEGWLEALPAGGRILEIGCGHGEPIAATLAAAGRRVTGIDPSAAMIAQARHTVPPAEFHCMTLAELDETGAFDGACSFFSFLCMDPIELRIGLERLHSAMKAGAPLLIVSAVPDLFTRTSPLRSVQGRTTWEWPYDHEDMAAVLTERGRWQVGAPALRYYDEETLEKIALDDLDPSAAEFRARTIKGVYALIAHRSAEAGG